MLVNQKNAVGQGYGVQPAGKMYYPGEACETPSACAAEPTDSIDGALASLDSRLHLLAELSQRLRHISAVLCGDMPMETCKDTSTSQPVPNGVVSKIYQREATFAVLAARIGDDIERLERL